MKIRRILALFFFLVCSISQGAETVPLSQDAFNPFPPGFMIPPDQPEGYVALPPGRPFPSLPSDPRDLKLSLLKNSKDEIEASVGGYRSLVGWKGDISGRSTVIHAGLEGDGFFLMRQEGSKFPLHSSDGLIGLYAEGIRGLNMYQLRYTHVSAHLSDGLFGLRQRIFYTRETLSLRLARQLDIFRVYAGYHYLVHTEPKVGKHSLQAGFYGILPMHWLSLHPYFGGDLKVRNADEGTTYNIILGGALVSSLGSPPLRLAVNYTKGHDLRGQFYKEKTEKWSFGLEMDF
ncbi:MAG: DUF1207 domain-containing protein [Bdellovibrionota bacterium]